MIPRARSILLLGALLLGGCGNRADITVAVENKTGVMIKDCAVRFQKGDLHSGVVLTNSRREFSYFVIPISESATLDVEFANNTKKTLRAYVGSAYDPSRAGTLVFEITPDSARVHFEADK